MKRRILASVVLGSAAALSLTGCLSGSDAPAGQETDVEAAWLDDGRIIAVVMIIMFSRFSIFLSSV